MGNLEEINSRQSLFFIQEGDTRKRMIRLLVISENAVKYNIGGIIIVSEKQSFPK